MVYYILIFGLRFPYLVRGGWGSILIYFIFSLFFCLLRYLNVDPFKSCFFFIFSMFFGVVYLSIFRVIWLNYFVSLLFLSGIFVILIYISSLSSLDYYAFKLNLILVLLSVFMFWTFLRFLNVNFWGLSRVYNFFYVSFY